MVKSCAVGCLLFYTQDRVDAQCEMNSLGAALKQPTVTAWMMLKRLIKYLLCTKDAVMEAPMPARSIMRQNSEASWLWAVKVWNTADMIMHNCTAQVRIGAAVRAAPGSSQ